MILNDFFFLQQLEEELPEILTFYFLAKVGSYAPLAKAEECDLDTVDPPSQQSTGVGEGPEVQVAESPAADLWGSSTPAVAPLEEYAEEKSAVASLPRWVGNALLSISDRFQFQEHIGSGSYGSVCAMVERETGEEVAAKVVAPEDVGPNEADIWSTFQHLHVLPLLEVRGRFILYLFIILT